jgi:hypothetical protein
MKTNIEQPVDIHHKTQKITVVLDHSVKKSGW